MLFIRFYKIARHHRIWRANIARHPISSWKGLPFGQLLALWVTPSKNQVSNLFIKIMILTEICNLVIKGKYTYLIFISVILADQIPQKHKKERTKLFISVLGIKKGENSETFRLSLWPNRKYCHRQFVGLPR